MWKIVLSILFAVVVVLITNLGADPPKALSLYELQVRQHGVDAELAHNFIVRMNPGVNPGRFTPLDSIPELDMYLVSRSDLSYVRDGYLQWIEPEITMEAIDTIPTDTFWGDQWGPAKINGPLAWDTETGDPGVLIAVVDTGIDYNHPDIAANYQAGGLDHVNGDNDPLDDNNHGTHVAGTINAVTNNNEGIAGMCWDCRVMAEKVLGAGGSGSSFAVAAGIIHAAHDSGADIINMSLGGGFSLSIENAVDHAWNNHNVLTVSACGNGGAGPSDCSFPAAHLNSMAISCSTQSDNLCSFSQRGPSVDVSAPGVGIISTTVGGNYSFFSGTSMSTPHVAGTAALALSVNPIMDNDELWGLLQLTADDVGTSSEAWNPQHGFGRVNAAGVVAGAADPPETRLPKPDAPTPTPPGPTNTPGPSPTPLDTPTITPTAPPVATPTCTAPTRTPTRRERTPTPCPGGPLPTPPTATQTPPAPTPLPTATETPVPPPTAPPTLTPVPTIPPPPTATPQTPEPLCEVLVRIDGVEQWIPKPIEFCLG